MRLAMHSCTTHGSGDAVPVLARARDLDAHCSHCHGRGGSAEDTRLWWDLAHTTPTELPICRSTASVDDRDRVLVPGHPEQSELLARMASDDASVRMPRGPTQLPDRAGIALLTAWIAAMPPRTCR
ncbi:MAG: c-type cytochrome domain-containing protein [Kofleriaceae bacterium]